MIRTRTSSLFIILIMLLSTGVFGLASGSATSPLVDALFVEDEFTLSTVTSSPSMMNGTGNIIYLKVLQIDTDREMVSITKSQGPQTGYYLIQFTDVVQQEWKDELEARGLDLISYVPENTYLADLNDVDIDRVTELEYVRWAGEYRSEYRIDPSVSQYGTGIEVNVLLFGPFSEQVADHVEASGGIILSSSPDKLQVRMNADLIRELADMEEVMWIEPYNPPVLMNDVAGDIIKTNWTRNTHNLTGSGQIVAVCDTGIDEDHPDFAGRIDIVFDLANDLYGSKDKFSGHGTHVSGSVLGNGSASGGQFAGSAPQAHLVFQAVEDDFEYLTGLPTDLNDLFQQAYDNDARIHTNSWGSSSAGAYTSYSREVDEFMWAHQDMLVLFSAGNDGIDANSDGIIDLDCIGSPATAKNCLTVGASENFRPTINSTYGYNWPFDYPVLPIYTDRIANDIEGIAAFSSRGPTNDGRLKPDVVAPGTYIYSTRSSDESQSGSNSSYMYMSGTSMATPLTAGTAALVRQHYVDVLNHTPSAALLKATIIQGAHDMYPGQYSNEDVGHVPDNSQGWGRVDLEQSLYPDNSTLHYSDAHSLSTEQTVVARYYVVNNSTPFKATLVWTDYPSSLISLENLVNDLDLAIMSPNGTVHDVDDNVNNVEQISIPSPVLGWYEVRVIGNNVPEGPQPFAMVITGNVSDNGTVTVPTLTSINITTSLPSLIIDGENLDLSASSFDQHNVSFSTVIHWNSSNTTVGTVNSRTGLFQALSGGNTLITAFNGSITDSILINVTGRYVGSINISNVTLYTGQSHTFTPQVLDQFNNSYDALLGWTSSNTTVGTINSTTGFFQALQGGSAMITATNNSVSGNATVTVLPSPVLSSINITTSIPGLVIDGDFLDLNASGYDQYNNSFSAQISWNSSNTTVGTINSSTGYFQALAGGSTMITAFNGSVTDSMTINVTVTVSTQPSSGGSSGGGGSSGEEYENIDLKEVESIFVIGGSQISYDFEEEQNAIMNVKFESLKNAGKISTTIEVLKDLSALASEEPPCDRVYQYMNIWVGKAGFATEENIADARIGFKIEASWLKDNGMEADNVRLYRYHEDAWQELTTVVSDRDEKYVYFEAQTPGFSPFAIGTLPGEVPVITDMEPSSIKPDEPSDTSQDAGMADESSRTEKEWPVNMVILSAIFLILVVAGYLYLKRKGK